MDDEIAREAVVVLEGAFESEDSSEIVESNVEFLNDLFDEHLTPDEVSGDALRSYYVDYYESQVENGGFSQFVYNSRWEPRVVGLVREGLAAIGAKGHLAVFEEGARLVEGLGAERLAGYLASEYFGENADRDALNAPNDRFEEVLEEEGLVTLNAAWLRGRPGLVVLSDEGMAAEVRRRGQALPDRERRVAALEDEPRYMKSIRALCARAGLELERVTAGDPSRVHDGEATTAWHFLTDGGHHHMVESRGKALMFRGHSKTDVVCEIDAPGE